MAVCSMYRSEMACRLLGVGLFKWTTTRLFLFFAPEGQIDDDTWLYGCLISTKNDDPIEPILRSVERFTV